MSQRKRSFTQRLLVSSIVLGLGIASASAWAQSTTSAIRGSVIGVDGNPQADTTIVIEIYAQAPGASWSQIRVVLFMQPTCPSADLTV